MRHLLITVFLWQSATESKAGIVLICMILNTGLNFLTPQQFLISYSLTKLAWICSLPFWTPRWFGLTLQGYDHVNAKECPFWDEARGGGGGDNFVLSKFKGKAGQKQSQQEEVCFNFNHDKCNLNFSYPQKHI